MTTTSQPPVGRQPGRLARTVHLLALGVYLGAIVGVLLVIMVVFHRGLEGLSGQARAVRAAEVGHLGGPAFALLDIFGLAMLAVAWISGLAVWFRSPRPSGKAVAASVVLLAVVTASALAVAFHYTPAINSLNAQMFAHLPPTDQQVAEMHRIHPRGSALILLNMACLLALFLLAGLSRPRPTQDARP